MRTHSLTLATATLIVALTALGPSDPRITGILPTAPARNPSAQVLTINGEAFAAGLTLEVRTPDGATRILRDRDIQKQTESSFQVSVVLAVKGAYGFVVMNPDGGVSAPFTLTIPSGVEAPVIEDVTPSKVSVLPDPQALRVAGKGFASGLVVALTDPTGTVTSLTGNDVRDVTPAGFRASAVFTLEGQYTLTVSNPDGGASNAFTILVMKKAGVQR
jgi:hypothetical protein